MDKHIRFMMVVIAGVWACSCSKGGFRDVGESPRMVPVTVSFGIEDIQDAMTRSAAALFPEVENWIFDYYYCQFNSTGISITSGHRRTDVTTGDMNAVDQVWLWDVAGSTVTYVANIVPADSDYGDDPGWEGSGGIVKLADNIETYKRIKFDMSKRLEKAEDGSLRHMPMCGYWTGDITTAINTESDPFHMSVTLGRMAVRLDIHVTNKSGDTVTGLKLDNAASQAYIYPQVSNTVLEDGDYMQFENSVSIANNATADFCFYTAPNFCAPDGNVTSLTFTKADGTTAVVQLCDNRENGDFNLYMNTIYTFTITLK